MSCVWSVPLDYYKLPDQTGQTISLDLGRGEHTYTVTGILEGASDNASRLFTLWISEEEALCPGNPAPYELRFRFAGSQIAEPERLRLDIAAFFREMGFPGNRPFTVPTILMRLSWCLEAVLRFTLWPF